MMSANMPVPKLSSAADFRSSLNLLVKDMDTVFEFVEPCDANAAVYSHRTYQLLLRACTEFEAICKEALQSIGHTSNRRDWNIDDYASLASPLNLDAYSVAFRRWNPSPKVATPFYGWAPGVKLVWYQDYNVVKHNRLGEFNLASMENICVAMAGVFLMLVRLGEIYDQSDIGASEWSDTLADGRVFTVYSGFPTLALVG